MLKLFVGLLLFIGGAISETLAMEIRYEVTELENGLGVSYRSDEQLIVPAMQVSMAGVEILFPGNEFKPVIFKQHVVSNDVVRFEPVRIGNLELEWILTQKNRGLIERKLKVTASADQRFGLKFPFHPVVQGEYASFSGVENERVLYHTGVRERRNQAYPVAMVRTDRGVYGVIADSPGYWENRCEVQIDARESELAIFAGDGEALFQMLIKPPEDARDTYQYQMDGWQNIKSGETREFTTWVFASPARNHYDAQVAFHLAVANAKGWNSSALEGILRNTSLYLLRRNLMRDENDQPREGKFIFISGMSYGWKQWVSTGLYSALGLDDPEALIESFRSVFWHRMDYEENAQYYLIWAALVQRTGVNIERDLVTRAYDFIRKHERNGEYIPPPLTGAPHPKGWKTYMDVLQYDDDDCPTSNQGFHCGALMAAQELGLPVKDEEIELAITAYRNLFNAEKGFMPTSRKQRDLMGQDSIYGAALTYAVFGRKLLNDDQMLRHYRASEKVKTPYGLRVISQADGTLLPGHDGHYCYGGSWFFCDSANYLMAGVHGIPDEEIDAKLVERIKLELVDHPAFNENIQTVTGKPNGNTPYADYSVYVWLRNRFRQRQKQSGVDRVGEMLDRHLSVKRVDGVLLLDLAQ